MDVDKHFVALWLKSQKVARHYVRGKLQHATYLDSLLSVHIWLSWHTVWLHMSILHPLSAELMSPAGVNDLLLPRYKYILLDIN